MKQRETLGNEIFRLLSFGLRQYFTFIFIPIDIFSYAESIKF